MMPIKLLSSAIALLALLTAAAARGGPFWPFAPHRMTYAEASPDHLLSGQVVWKESKTGESKTGIDTAQVRLMSANRKEELARAPVDSEGKFSLRHDPIDGAILEVNVTFPDGEAIASQLQEFTFPASPPIYEVRRLNLARKSFVGIIKVVDDDPARAMIQIISTEGELRSGQSTTANGEGIFYGYDLSPVTHKIFGRTRAGTKLGPETVTAEILRKPSTSVPSILLKAAPRISAAEKVHR